MKRFVERACLVVGYGMVGFGLLLVLLKQLIDAGLIG